MEKYAILNSNNIAQSISTYYQHLENPPANYIEVNDDSMLWHKYENSVWSTESYENGTTLEEVKNNKIQELESKCTEILNSGFNSNCLGTTRKFSSTDLNRSFIMGLVSKAQLILNNVDLTDKSLDWKAEDDPVCYSWTPQQILILGSDMSTFMTNNIKHKELLQAYVKTLATVEEVNKVTWDTVIPTTTT